MAKPTDAVVPILQKIHSDVSKLAGAIEAQGKILIQHSGKLETIEEQMTFPIGRMALQANDIEILKGEVRDLRRRVADLEARGPQR